MWKNITKKDSQYLQSPFTHNFAAEEIAKIAFVLKMIPKKSSVLDCGCGIGWTAEWLQRAGHTVVGNDIDDSMLIPFSHGEKFIKECFETYTSPNTYDVVLFFASLHHTHGWKIALSKAFENLKSGGMLILVEPGWNNGKRKADREFLKKNPTAIELGMAPFKTIPVLRTIGFRNIRTFPNVGFYLKCFERGYPTLLSSIAVGLYRWFDGIVIAKKAP